jgi:hypothetical protein
MAPKKNKNKGGKKNDSPNDDDFDNNNSPDIADISDILNLYVGQHC